jgi:hypothetical protein
LIWRRRSTLATLPARAFFPPYVLKENDRRSFVDRRDSLFAACTPAEQQCLLALAEWLASEQLQTTGNYYADRRLGEGLRSRFLERLSSLVDAGQSDVLLGVTQFLQVFPFEIAFDLNYDLRVKLTALTLQYVDDPQTPALKRLEAVLRCIGWPRDAPPWLWGKSPRDLICHNWRLLDSLVREDLPAAIRVIDEHWTPRASSAAFSTAHLHGSPDLAHRLAVALRPHRPSFAAEMLEQSIWVAWFEWKWNKVTPAAQQALEADIDASCVLLAEWTLDGAAACPADVLHGLRRLFRFGNPLAAYWPKLPEECMAAVRDMHPGKERYLMDRLGDVVFELLADVAFYGVPGMPQAQEAHAMFQASVASSFDKAQGWEWDLNSSCLQISESASLLDDKVLSRRNRHVAPNPDHFLLHTLDDLFFGLLQRLVAREPEAALQHRVSLTLNVQNEALTLKHHRLLREEFEPRARANPADAGLALKKLIAYCGYSQMDDTMFKRDLCQQSFEALLPVLEAISPADAAVARTGIDWDLRGDI